MFSVMLINWYSHVVTASDLVWMQPQSNVLGYLLQDPQCHKPTQWGSFTYLLSLRCFWQIKTKPRQRWSLCWMPSHPEFIIVAVAFATKYIAGCSCSSSDYRFGIIKSTYQLIVVFIESHRRANTTIWILQCLYAALLVSQSKHCCLIGSYSPGKTPGDTR